ncbi:protein YIPF5 homolog [Rhodnius prolixus]|uniref:Uncharacterized protein n=1 Tax=Rhodnius prolixus TaxID=13249 RepID=T1HDH9_RHOPR
MSRQQYNYNMWEDDGWSSNENFCNSPNEMMINTSQLSFQQNDYNEDGAVYQQHYNANHSAKMAFFYEPPSHYSLTGNIPKDESQFPHQKGQEYYQFDEPPLLEELEIFPDQILQKVKVVLDPFKNDVPMDCDLGGPLFFYLCLAFTMFLSGGKLNFGYVYGISVIGCILMYFILKAMTKCDTINVMGVASTLGYCILPVVLLSALGVFFYLNNYFGYTLATIAVGWASFAASKIFCTITEDFTQRPLIMYPCALLYGAFTILVIL